MTDLEKPTPIGNSLTKEQAIEQGHPVLTTEGHVQSGLPDFDVPPFDSHRQEVREASRQDLEELISGRETLEGFASKQTDKMLLAEREQYTDILTGLWNRRYLNEQLKKNIRIASMNGLEVVVMIVDLDHFKLVNDEHGHINGDKVLVETANAMKSLFRKSTDIVARWGGEEFAIVFFKGKQKVGAKESTIEERADKVREEITKRIRTKYGKREQIEGQDGWLTTPQTASIGIATSNDISDLKSHGSLDEFMGKADIALYNAKDGGRDRAVRYTPDLKPKPVS